MLAMDACQSLEGCAAGLRAMHNTQQDSSRVLEHMYSPCGGCENDICTDRTSLILLWQVATQCVNSLVPTACIPQRDLEAFVNDLADFGDDEVCWFVTEVQMAMTSDWALHGCPTPLRTPAPEEPSGKATTTPSGPLSPCDEARTECTGDDGCSATIVALHGSAPSLKIQAALGLCSTPQSMFKALNVYSRCPVDLGNFGSVLGESGQELGVTLPCFNAMVEALASAHGGAAASVCDVAELPTMDAVYFCTGASPPAPEAPAEVPLANLTGCPLAVATCMGDDACGPNYEASLAADSVGKMQLLLAPCESMASLNAMLSVALECPDFLPCSDCMPCEIIDAMKEVVGMEPEDILCMISPELTQNMVEHMEAMGCPNVPAGVYAGPSRRLREPHSSDFQWPRWLSKVQAKHVPAVTV